MPTLANPYLIDDIKRYGAFDISACFNCGNCTAVCPLSDEQGSFPRKPIRLGQIGDRKRLIEGPEAWLCYYCGECSATCPRQAEPGAYMAALRRYSIASYEPTGLAGFLYRSVAALVIVTLLLMLVLGAFMASVKAPESQLPHVREWLFKDSAPYLVIHDLGIAVFAIAGLTLVAGAWTAIKRMGAGIQRPSVSSMAQAARATIVEVATMRRHWEEVGSDAASLPMWLRPSVVHRTIMWGFVGLLIATTLDFLFIGILPLGLTTFWPARILGIVAGIALMVGTVAATVRRVKKLEKNVAKTLPDDFWLLAFLFVLGLTGFWLLGVVTARAASPFNDLVLLLHAAMAMELVLLLAFTKLAHVVYRPLALFFHQLRLQNRS